MAAKSGGQKGAPQEAPKQRPAFEERYGRIKATVWRQESDQGPWYSVVFTRSYKDAQGNWQTSNSFGLDDTLPLSELARRVFHWMQAQRTKDRAAQNGTEQQPERQPGDDSDIPF
jgi:hypothetical protein